MKVRIKIITEITGEVEAELTDEFSPRTFNEIVKALPIESKASRWGDEVYFPTSVSVPEENARELVDAGTIAYWPPGNCLCIFWGPTPSSKTRDEIRPASPVNVVGRVLDNVKLFDKVKAGDWIKVVKAD